MLAPILLTHFGRAYLVERELLTKPEHMSLPSIFCRVRFTLLSFFLWPWCCMYFRQLHSLSEKHVQVSMFKTYSS
jgi:hypothetical protein